MNGWQVYLTQTNHRKDSLLVLPVRFLMPRYEIDSHISNIFNHVFTQDFPRYVINFAKRFATGSYASPTSSAAPSSSNSNQPFSRDTFGFRQIIVAATAFGKIYGIDSSSGNIVWNRVLGLGWAGQIGGRVQPVKLYVTKSVSDGGDPEVVLIAQRRAQNVRALCFRQNFN